MNGGNMEQALLQCTNLVKCYGKKQALNGVDLSVMPGRITGLLGPNGSGKTTIIKIANGLLTPTSGELRINGLKPNAQTKAMVSYLPERTYLANWMKVQDIIRYFQDFYADFDMNRAYEMLRALNINPEDPLKTMSKGMCEKVQLILVMSRRAQLYILDEPIAGVDPAARDYILRTILNNYDSNAAILISTHLISDVESVLDDVIFLRDGNVILQSTTDEIREKEGKSVDQFFREVFKC
ncbi:MAG: ABC transporter ATP-binding protein [Lachnospiraceae bacterium]|nr:ABC transporter ATP-binding protein [Lachnospiraceae bacterium]